MRKFIFGFIAVLFMGMFVSCEDEVLSTMEDMYKSRIENTDTIHARDSINHRSSEWDNYNDSVQGTPISFTVTTTDYNEKEIDYTITY